MRFLSVSPGLSWGAEVVTLCDLIWGWGGEGGKERKWFEVRIIPPSVLSAEVAGSLFVHSFVYVHTRWRYSGKTMNDDKYRAQPTPMMKYAKHRA